MSKNPNRRLSRAVLVEDETIFNALQNLTGYTPPNPNYAVTAIKQSLEDMRGARVDEDQAAASFATRRDIAINKEWAFHYLILGAKEQAIALFGKDSVQVQELGLKRKSEYKSRKPKAKAAQ